MISKNINKLINILEEETGAAIGFNLKKPKKRSSLETWFSDINKRNGLIFSLQPYGLKNSKVSVSYGPFSKPIISQIKKATEEKKNLSEALINTLTEHNKFFCDRKPIQEWSFSMLESQLDVVTNYSVKLPEEQQFVNTCKNIISPLMGAFAELIGYEEIFIANELLKEGAEISVVSKKRERNPRNRLLCIKIHGEICKICKIDLKKIYSTSKSLLEVHHIEPLSELDAPKKYDPRTDLVPLCPNCHRAIHSRVPAFDLETIKKRLADNGN